VWRRLEVIVKPASVVVSLEPRRGIPVAEHAIKEAFDTARASVAANHQTGHHLGDIAANERVLGDRASLASREGYEAALKSRLGHPAVPPEWAARIQIDTEPDATAPGAIHISVLLANVTPERPREGVDAGLEERSLFDAGLEVEFDGRLEPFDFLLAPKDYRSNPELPAKGI